MRKLLIGLLITGSVCLACTPRAAVAGSGDVAAGIVGGLAVGTLFGAAVASGPRYYQPAPRLRSAGTRVRRADMLLDSRRSCLGWLSGDLV
jgi:hypothetical protein